MGAILTMLPRQPISPVREMLAEAAEHRRRGDLAAAFVIENDAIRAIHAIAAAARQEVRR